MINQKKKGFTLVELLISVSLLAILAVIIIINLNGNFKKQQEKEYAEFIDKVKSAANVYLAANKDAQYYAETNDYYTLTVEDLEKSGLIDLDRTINPLTKTSLKSLNKDDIYKYIKIYKDEKTELGSSNAILIEYPVKDVNEFHYIISYENGKECKKQLISQSNNLTTLCIPTSENAAFKGWYQDKKFTLPFKEEKEENGEKLYKITDNITLYAKWEISIKYNMNGYGENECSNQTAILDEKISICNPSDKNATFIGWYYDKELTKQGPSVTSEYKIDTIENIVLYAKWETKEEPKKLKLAKYQVKSVEEKYNAGKVNILFTIEDDSGKDIQYYLIKSDNKIAFKNIKWKNLKVTRKGLNPQITKEDIKYTFEQRNLDTGKNTTYGGKVTYHLYVRYKNDTNEENSIYSSIEYNVYKKCDELENPEKPISTTTGACSATCWDGINNKPTATQTNEYKDKYFSNKVCQVKETVECNVDKICCDDDYTYEKVSHYYNKDDKSNWILMVEWRKVSKPTKTTKIECGTEKTKCNKPTCSCYPQIPTCGLEYECHSPNDKNVQTIQFSGVNKAVISDHLQGTNCGTNSGGTGGGGGCPAGTLYHSDFKRCVSYVCHYENEGCDKNYWYGNQGENGCAPGKRACLKP